MTPPDMNYISEDSSVSAVPPSLGAIDSVRGVRSIIPVVYRAGIVRKDDDIHGVIFKGLPQHEAAPFGYA